jgi:hypothetical protein
MSRWKIGTDAVQTWVKWTRELNIFHTFDRESKAARGYPASANFTWKQGLERLRLSRIMAAPNGVDAAGFNHYQERVPFSDVNSSDEELVEKFCMIIESIDQATRRLNSRTMSGEQWQQCLFEICDRLIEIPADLKGETAVRQALLRAFEDLRLYDRLQENSSPSPLNVDLITEFIRTNLGSISGGHGNYLTGGVTISALQPMRPIPFRIVYVLGMEEGRFPGRADFSSLDLRLAKRRIGDISLPERNCYLFLEMLLSVRDKLYISYVARDLQKDRLQQPCSVVNQLKRYVELEILPNGQPFRVAEVPLAGFSGRYLDPKAINAWSDVLVNDSLSDRVAYYRSQRLWEKFESQASDDELARAARFHPDLTFDAAVPDPEESQTEKITSHQLKNFLENPVRLKIQRYLGLYDEKETIEDIVLHEDEPFFSEFPLDYRLKIDSIKLWIDAYFSKMDSDMAKPDPEAFYQQVYDAYRRKGYTPEGAFAAIDRDELLGHVRDIRQTLTPVLEMMQVANQIFRIVSIGDPAEEQIPENTHLEQKRFDPLSLSVPVLNSNSKPVTQVVEIHGQLPWMWQDAEKVWHALVLTGSGKRPKEPDRYVLGPVLFYLIGLTADESSLWIDSAAITVHIVYREIVKEWTYRIDRKTAKVYLTELVSSVLNQSTRSWLPFETATTRSIKPHKIPAGEETEAIRMQFAAEIVDAFADEEDYLIQMAKPTVPKDAFDRVRSRFKIYFDRVSTNPDKRDIIRSNNSNHEIHEKHERH